MDSGRDKQNRTRTPSTDHIDPEIKLGMTDQPPHRQIHHPPIATSKDFASDLQQIAILHSGKDWTPPFPPASAIVRRVLRH